jgi:hypothetical protein
MDDGPQHTVEKFQFILIVRILQHTIFFTTISFVTSMRVEQGVQVSTIAPVIHQRAP